MDRDWAGCGRRAPAPRPRTAKKRRPKPGEPGTEGALQRTYVADYDLEYRAELSRVMRRLLAQSRPQYDGSVVPNPFYPLPPPRPPFRLSPRHLRACARRMVWELQRPIVGLPVVVALMSVVVGLIVL